MPFHPIRPLKGLSLGLLAMLLACSGAGSNPSASQGTTTPQAPVVPNITKVTTLAGVPGTSGTADGGPGYGLLWDPQAIAMDSQGNLFVADTGAHIIRKLTPAGVLTTFAGAAFSPGYSDGTGPAARFNFPLGIAIDASDNLYVTDYTNHLIRKITPGGLVTTFAGAPSSGYADGQGSAARFSSPMGIALDRTGNLFIADSENHRIRKITPGGLVSTVAGGTSIATTDGPVATASLNHPYSVAVAADGTLYFTEPSNHVIRKVAGGNVLTHAGMAGVFGSADGTGPAARFRGPAGISLDAAGALYVADACNHTLRKVLADGTVTTLAGTPGAEGYGTGPVSTVKLNGPQGCLVSGTRVFVAQFGSFVIQAFD